MEFFWSILGVGVALFLLQLGHGLEVYYMKKRTPTENKDSKLIGKE